MSVFLRTTGRPCSRWFPGVPPQQNPSRTLISYWLLIGLTPLDWTNAPNIVIFRILSTAFALVHKLPSVVGLSRVADTEPSVPLDNSASLWLEAVKGKGPLYALTFVTPSQGALVAVLSQDGGDGIRLAVGNAGSNAAGGCYTCARIPRPPGTPQHNFQTRTWTNTRPQATCGTIRCVHSYSASWAVYARVERSNGRIPIQIDGSQTEAHCLNG